MQPSSEGVMVDRSTGNPDGSARPKDNWFTVTRFRYIPPSCLSQYDTRYDQGLERLLYMQTLIDEDIEA